MSGFVAVWHRDGASVEPARASSMLAALAHRGPDGRRMLFRSSAALGHQHFWTTPEEVGEEQPVSNEEAGLDVAFDGRLDNREDLLAAMGGRDSSVSDASLVLRAYERWGDACFERILGPFAAVVLDGRRSRLVAARDGMGSRTLYYCSTPDLVLVASEERALLALPEVEFRLNEVALAEFFAVSVPPHGMTFFKGIKELLPGHVLVVSPEGERLRRYWSPDLERRIRYRSDQEYAEHFRSLLADSVHCRLRTAGPLGSMMSGGMDSTSVGALAALELKHRGAGPLLTFSWLFDELTECDERRWIGRMVEHFGLDATYICGDRAWPLRDVEHWPIGANQPWSSLYALLRQELYRAAARRGCRTLLDGGFADRLYTGDEEWVTDLVRDGRFLTVGRELLGLLRNKGAAICTDAGVRRLGRHVLMGSSGELERDRTAAPWLTDYARVLLFGGPSSGSTSWRARRPEQHEALFGPFASLSGNRAEFANACGVELRDPFRDRRLVEFALAIPAYQLFGRGRTKYVQRNAMSGLLPSEITDRTERTWLTPLFHRGMVERGRYTARTILSRKDAIWRRYVREDSIRDSLRMEELPDGVESLVPWQCISAQLWIDRLASNGIASFRRLRRGPWG